MPTRPAPLAALTRARPLASLGGAISRLMARPLPVPDALKGSGPVPLFALETAGQPVWMPRDYSAFAREGVMQNAIVYRCVRMIAEAAASVPLCLYEGDAEIAEHPLLDLLARPSPTQTGTDLLESWYGFLLVSGNTYLEAVALGSELRELHVLRPDRMKVIPGADGWPAGYEYVVGGTTLRISGEALPGVRPVLQMKLFHPANDHYGLSPIEAASTAIDLHNAASRWNKALLDNSARPSGALVYTNGGNLSGDQFDRLKAELEASFQGARNAGRPLLLEGGLDWKSMSMSPRDMDFLEAKHAAAREIALAIGVPPMLLGIPGDNTYSNLAEANRTFWRQTVLPLVNRTARALSGWLSPAYGMGVLRLAPDLDQVEALAPEREALWARLEKASFLTDDEKRAAAGYGPKGAAGRAGVDDSAEQRFNPNHDDQGRFTFGPAGDAVPQLPSPNGSPTSGSDGPKGLFDEPVPVQQTQVPPSISIPGSQAGTLDGDLTLGLARSFSAGGMAAGIYTNGQITQSGNSINVPGPAAIIAPGMVSHNNGQGSFSASGYAITRGADGRITIEPAPGN